MEIVLHDDAREFARLARPLLDADPLRHTIALTVLDGLIRSGGEAAVLLTVLDGPDVVAAALRTSGRPALVSAVPRELATVVEAALADADPEVGGASGPVPEVDAFAAAHAVRTGARVDVDLRMRLFALDRLVMPTVPGVARLATVDDVDVLAGWRLAFAVELHEDWADPGSPEEVVVRSLQLGAGEVLWEVGGMPVSQASARPVVAAMSRIGPVYTPPEHRRRGYAAAATAAAARWALEAGAERVLLFTDLENPTTNALYPRLGFRPVHDAREVRFHR